MDTPLAVIAALASFGLAVAVLLRDPTSLPSRFLVAGLLLLSAEQVAAVWSAATPIPSEVGLREAIRFLLKGIAVPVWLGFALTYGRAAARQRLKAWIPYLTAAALLLGGLVVVPVGRLFLSGPVYQSEAERWVIPLGIRGFLIEVGLVLLSTLILANLEGTLRASIGRVRWQIKFAVLGVGGLFAVLVYSASRGVLFRAVAPGPDLVTSFALLGAALMVGLSLRRSRTLDFDVYLSQSVLKGSLTIIGVGFYLVVVGVVVQLVRSFGWRADLRDVVIFLAVLAFVLVLLSDRFQQDLGRWTRRHFRRPTYDYRQLWTRFSQATGSRLDEREAGRAIVNLTSSALDSLSVSLWSVEPGSKNPTLLASTAVTPEQLRGLELGWLVEVASRAEGIEELIPNSEAGDSVSRIQYSEGETGDGRREMGGSPDSPRPNVGQASSLSLGFGPGQASSLSQQNERDQGPAGTFDSRPPTPDSSPLAPGSTLLTPEERGTRNEERRYPSHLPAPSSRLPHSEFGIRNSEFGMDSRLFHLMSTGTPGSESRRAWYLVPLKVRAELLGLLLLGERVRWKPLGWEDRELLEVLADQSAGVLMNLRLARHLKEASEMEAFQTMSAFFLHDLKNLANRLSLTVQNLPRHFDKPEFREDALRTLDQSVEKIRGMCSRLSLIREKLELRTEPVDLREVTAQCLEELRPQVGSLLVEELHPTGPVNLDPSQFRKVVVNLVLNGWEAIVLNSEFRIPNSEGKTGDGRRETGGSPADSSRPNVGQASSLSLGFGLGQASSLSQENERDHRPPGTFDSRLPTPDSHLPHSEFGIRNSEFRLLVRTYPENRWAILEVRDTGCGMIREFMEQRLFHPFQTTKPRGMGIGLYQCRMIVDAHAGRIEVESEPGRGSCFRVLLPRAEE